MSPAATAVIRPRLTGYLIIDVGPHPNPAKAADGKRLHPLAADLQTADVVRRIFAEDLAGRGGSRRGRGGVPALAAGRRPL